MDNLREQPSVMVRQLFTLPLSALTVGRALNPPKSSSKSNTAVSLHTMNSFCKNIQYLKVSFQNLMIDCWEISFQSVDKKTKYISPSSDTQV